MNEIDAYLYRAIKPGKEFEKLIPKAQNKTIEAGTGYTDHSIDVMKKCVEDYSWQMEAVAEKLEQSSLIDCVDAVFDFIYNHFQYKADSELQKLRSPAYSWFDRHNGIDCKSYSILASSILTEMGINHYIRKIIQPAGDSMQGAEKENFESSYSHVYVIVPKNQKTNSLSQGYYVIDGTVADNQEPYFLKAKDEFMQGLKHVIMNAPVAPVAYNYGGDDWTPFALNGAGDGGLTTSIIKEGVTNVVTSGKIFSILKPGDFFKKLNIGKFFSFINTPIKCWGGSAYTEGWLSSDLFQYDQYVEKVINQINDALQANDMAKFSERVNTFVGMILLIDKRIATKRAQGWNPCSTKNFTVIQRHSQFYKTSILLALDRWLEESFNSTIGQSVPYSITKFRSEGYPVSWSAGGDSIDGTTVSVPYETYSKKLQIPVPNFQLTEYLASTYENPQSFDANQYFESIKQLYALVQNPASILNQSNTPPVSTSAANASAAQIQDINNKPQQAGMSTILGLLIIGAGVSIAYNMATKPATKKTAA